MIDSRAVIDPSARIASNVSIGPFTIVGADVVIGEGTRIGPHNVIKGPTEIGANNEILQFCTIGEATPDLKYAGEDTRLVIGDNNTIREGVTIHRGTVQDRGETRIGNHNLIMAYAHIGHDSVIGDHTIMVNNSSLAGHIHLGDWAIVSGYSGVHQYCRVGKHSFIGAYTYISQDVPAYVLVAGIPAHARMINVEGLKRRGFTADQIKLLQKAYRTVYRGGSELAKSLDELEKIDDIDGLLGDFISSIRTSSRGIVR